MNVSQLLEAYLVPGAPGYRRRTTPTVAEAIDVDPRRRRRRGLGASVLGRRRARRGRATPSTRFAAAGPGRRRGLLRRRTPSEQTRLVADRCAERGLLTTGSADFHGPDHPLFSAFRAFELHGLEPDLGPIRSGTAERGAVASAAA